MFRRIDRRLAANFDWTLAISMLLLCSLGLAIIYSAGFDPTSGTSQSMIRQAVSMGIGLAAFVVCVFINTSFWKRMAYPFYLICLVLLALVLVKGIVAGGARRWLEIAGFRMQPSEFMKVALIILFAKMFSREAAPRDGYTLKNLWFPAILLVMPALLIMKEPDLGTALCLLLIGGSMILLAGVRPGTLLRLALCGAIFALPAWGLLKDYQRKRVLTFLSPELDPLGSGYHAMQSKIAVGSGAVTGKGFLQGTQTQLRFLPEQTTDFIFSVLAEEWGFIGSVVVLFLYGVLLARLLAVANRCTDSFAAYVTVGVAAMMFWHVVINIGMVIGVMPVVGVTLKLLSFGGSSVITAMAALGIVAGFTIRRYRFV